MHTWKTWVPSKVPYLHNISIWDKSRRAEDDYASTWYGEGDLRIDKSGILSSMVGRED